MSYLQNLGADRNNQPRQTNTDAFNKDRESTIAHLLVASGYANAPADQAMRTAYSVGATKTEVKPSSIFQTLTPLDAKSGTAIKAAESVTVGQSAPLMRSVLTATLLTSEPIQAQRAAIDPDCHNLSRTDAVAVVRTNIGQPIVDVPIVRQMTSETVPVIATVPKAESTMHGATTNQRSQTDLIFAPAPRTVQTAANSGQGEISPPTAKVVAPRLDVFAVQTAGPHVDVSTGQASPFRSEVPTTQVAPLQPGQVAAVRNDISTGQASPFRNEVPTTQVAPLQPGQVAAVRNDISTGQASPFRNEVATGQAAPLQPGQVVVVRNDISAGQASPLRSEVPTGQAAPLQPGQVAVVRNDISTGQASPLRNEISTGQVAPLQPGQVVVARNDISTGQASPLRSEFPTGQVAPLQAGQVAVVRNDISTGQASPFRSEFPTGQVAPLQRNDISTGQASPFRSEVLTGQFAPLQSGQVRNDVLPTVQPTPVRIDLATGMSVAPRTDVATVQAAPARSDVTVPKNPEVTSLSTSTANPQGHSPLISSFLQNSEAPVIPVLHKVSPDLVYSAATAGTAVDTSHPVVNSGSDRALPVVPNATRLDQQNNSPIGDGGTPRILPTTQANCDRLTSTGADTPSQVTVKTAQGGLTTGGLPEAGTRATVAPVDGPRPTVDNRALPDNTSATLRSDTRDSLGRMIADSTKTLGTDSGVRPNTDPRAAATDGVVRPSLDPARTVGIDGAVRANTDPAKPIAADGVVRPSLDPAKTAANDGIIRPNLDPAKTVGPDGRPNSDSTKAIPNVDPAKTVGNDGVVRPNSDPAKTVVNDGVVRPNSDPAKTVGNDGVVRPNSDPAKTVGNDGVVRPNSDPAKTVVNDGVVRPNSDPAKTVVNDGVVRPNSDPAKTVGNDGVVRPNSDPAKTVGNDGVVRPNSDPAKTVGNDGVVRPNSDPAKTVGNDGVVRPNSDPAKTVGNDGVVRSNVDPTKTVGPDGRPNSDSTKIGSNDGAARPYDQSKTGNAEAVAKPNDSGKTGNIDGIARTVDPTKIGNNDGPTRPYDQSKTGSNDGARPTEAQGRVENRSNLEAKQGDTTGRPADARSESKTDGSQKTLEPSKAIDASNRIIDGKQLEPVSKSTEAGRDFKTSEGRGADRIGERTADSASRNVDSSQRGIDVTGSRPVDNQLVRNQDGAAARNSDGATNKSADAGVNRGAEPSGNKNLDVRIADQSTTSKSTDGSQNRGQDVPLTNRSEIQANKSDSATRSDFSAGRPTSEATQQSSLSIKSGESRSEIGANKPGEIRSETGANRTNDTSRTGEIPSSRPGEIRLDSGTNRVSENPIKLNTENPANRSEIASTRPGDMPPSRTADGVTRGSELPVNKLNDIVIDGKKNDNSENVRQPILTVASDMVATQKEAAAIRNVLSELKQNQNLSTSEVLELPSFKEAMRLIDALKSNDSTTENDGKHFTTSFVEAMRLSDFLKLLEKASELEQKKEHKKQWAARSLTQHRVRYLVKKDDTLENVAERILGDIRFVQLLITINRAEIIFTIANGKTVSTIYEGQYLWIPTPNELNIHKKHYFNSNSAAIRGNELPPEAETPIMVEEYEAPTTVRDFAARHRSITAPPVGHSAGPVSSPMALVLYRLRFAGNRNSVNLDEIEPAQPSDRRHHKVRLGETLQSIAVHDPLMKDVNMWILICRLNNLATAIDVVGRPRTLLTRGETIMLPNAAEIEEFRLLSKLVEIAELAGKKIDVDFSRRSTASAAPAASAHCKVERQMSIQKLADRCRMISTDNNDTAYSIKLQIESDGKWSTVSSYESKGGKTLRYTYKIDGSKSCLEVGLPAAVSREMAVEDFQRNWRFYHKRFNSIKTDTVELEFEEAVAR